MTWKAVVVALEIEDNEPVLYTSPVNTKLGSNSVIHIYFTFCVLPLLLNQRPKTLSLEDISLQSSKVSHFSRLKH